MEIRQMKPEERLRMGGCALFALPIHTGMKALPWKRNGAGAAAIPWRL